MAMRVGIDLVSVNSVQEAIQQHAERYLRRVYTEDELRDCQSPQGIDPLRLAARFAAKEATLKVLRPADEGVSWRAIELLRHPSGFVELQLSGAAADLAGAGGLSDFSVSITHETGLSCAVVVASCP